VVNDDHGRDAGDELLREVARRLQNYFEPVGGDVARATGEMFAALLPGVDHASAVRLCKRLCVSFESRPFVTRNDMEVALSPRAGMTTMDDSNARAFSSPMMLLTAAERALDAARCVEGSAVRAFVPQTAAAA
jgi:diguanylate cyclase (GGDEF)-like protein